MGKIIGIDLGTTDSCVVILENGNVRVIENAEGARTTPSVIAYTNGGKTLVGQPAKRQAVTNPQNTLYTVKRLIGRRFEENVVQKDIQMVPHSIVKIDSSSTWVKVKGQKMAPPQISAKVLKKMKKTAEDYLGEPATEAVITVPAYSNDNQRQATEGTGRIAGLDAERIVSEPTTAALAYDLGRAKDGHTVIVCDLGGGTFSVSAVETAEADGKHQFKVLATNGDIFLGGENFDIRLIDYLIDEFKKESDTNLKSDPLAMRRLKEAAEKVKVGLSSTQQTGVNLPYVTADASGSKHLNVKASRAKLEFLVEDLVQRTIKPCRTTLEDAGLGVSGIHEVILVGGQTRMPLVQKAVTEFFGKEVRKGVNPDEAVAVGTAIRGAVLTGDMRDVLLLDVTPLTFGIETLGGVMTDLIEENTTIPTKKSQVFSIVGDNQGAVTIHMLQDERKQAAQDKSLSKFDLADIPPAPCGVPQIEVTFDIDASGILHVSAKDKATDKQQSIMVKASSGLSEDETQQMIHDAEVNAEGDRRFEELTAARSQGDALVHTTHKMITEAGDKVTAESKATIEKALGELEAAVKGGDKVKIEAKINALSQASAPLAQKMYAEQAQQGEDAPQGEQAKAADDVVDAESEEVKDNK